MAGGMKRLAGETAIYGVSSIVGKFLNWMLVPMYTRVLATESDFGIVTKDVYKRQAFSSSTIGRKAPLKAGM